MLCGRRIRLHQDLCYPWPPFPRSRMLSDSLTLTLACGVHQKTQGAPGLTSLGSSWILYLGQWIVPTSCRSISFMGSWEIVLPAWGWRLILSDSHLCQTQELGSGHWVITNGCVISHRLCENCGSAQVYSTPCLY